MKNITLHEYVRLKDVTPYNALQFLKPKPTYGVHVMNVNDMTYEEVKAVTRRLRTFKGFEDIKDIFETCFKIDEQTFWNGKVTHFFQARNYIVETFKKLLERERKLLTSVSKNSILWEQAGGNRLDKWSDVLPINQLGKIYGIYPFELSQYKYKEILTLLTVEKEQREVEEKFNELNRK